MTQVQDWIILNSVTVDGITYTRGEGLPSTVTPQPIDRCVETGVILRRGGLAPGVVPRTADQYLQATDYIVLDNIATHRPSAETLRAMEMLARQASRSPILVGALRVAALYAAEGPIARTEPEVEEEVEEEKEDEDETAEPEPENEAVAVTAPRRAASRR